MKLEKWTKVQAGVYTHPRYGKVAKLAGCWFAYRFADSVQAFGLGRRYMFQAMLDCEMEYATRRQREEDQVASK